MRRSNFKYLLVFVFGISLLAPHFTNFICFKQIQLAHRESIKERFNASLKLEELEQLTFSESEFNDLTWDGEDEFYLDHKKFDLFGIEQKGDSLIIWAWWDHKESHLEKRFIQMLHTSQKQPLKDKPDISLDKLSKYLKNSTTPSWEYAIADSDIKNSFIEKPKDPFLSIASPPPLLF